MTLRILFLLSIPGFGFAQIIKDVRKEAIQLRVTLEQRHVYPLIINDQFANRVFENVITSIDPDRLYFSNEDLSPLQHLKSTIDDDLKGTSWKFYPQLLKTFKESLLQSKALLEGQTPFTITLNEQIRVDTSWVEKRADKEARWRNLIKLEVIEEVAAHEDIKDILLDKSLLNTIVDQARIDAVNEHKRILARILDAPDSFEQYVSVAFLRAISNAFDPHSNYFTPAQMEIFVSSLSTQGFEFGFGIEEQNDEGITITSLTPGGPAWKSGEVHHGDVIEKIRRNGSDWVDVSGMSVEEVSELLADSDDKVVDISLRKPAGKTKVVQLRKAKLTNDDDVVKSFILEGERRVGYIYLPDFYSQWGDATGSRCASDVAREIIKLKKQKIEALILDIRFNAGGSLQEAVAMAGIFIDAGPIGIISEKGKPPVTLKDMNRGTIYDGPLVVAVNGQSASASELLAAALQDYRRAIIVGSQTFGKATGQEMISLEPGKPDINFSAIDTKKGWGYSTVTTSRIYRITGQSIQKAGVEPDVALPDLNSVYVLKESFYRHAIKQDSIVKKTYYQPLTNLPVDILRFKSQQRLQSHEGFKAIAAHVERVKKESEKLSMKSLSIVCNELKELNDVADKIGQGGTAKFSVRSNFLTSSGLEVTQKSDMDSAWEENLIADISLQEVYNITCDYLELLNHK